MFKCFFLDANSLTTIAEYNLTVIPRIGEEIVLNNKHYEITNVIYYLDEKIVEENEQNCYLEVEYTKVEIIMYYKKDE